MLIKYRKNMEISAISSMKSQEQGLGLYQKCALSYANMTHWHEYTVNKKTMGLISKMNT